MPLPLLLPLLLTACEADPVDTADEIEEFIGPSGFMYDETNGNVINTWELEVSGPALTTVSFELSDGAQKYTVVTDALAGYYFLGFEAPDGYQKSTSCEPSGTYEAGGGGVVTLGSSNTALTLDDYSCANNPYHLTIYLDEDSPELRYNNIPVAPE
jgi:hypothetical protein